MPPARDLGDHAEAARTTEDWSRRYLDQIRGGDFGFDAAVAIEAKINAAASTANNAELPQRRRAAIVQFHHMAFDSFIEEAARRAPDDPRTLSRLADMLTMAPQGSAIPNSPSIRRESLRVGAG